MIVIYELELSTANLSTKKSNLIMHLAEKKNRLWGLAMYENLRVLGF